jgi:hypothetical protein
MDSAGRVDYNNGTFSTNFGIFTITTYGVNVSCYAIDANASGTYPIYAGQTAVPGASVTYDAATDIITINLGPNMQLQNVSEPVKVEGYNTLPSSRSSAGLFTLYKGTNLTVKDNNSNYYVVHLDVEVCNN